ncbi:MAG: hypothetical protein PWQ43_670 [Rikenellaceae bacterium]|nr:hypothetical protein [Rikenellaceae bacterium]
MVVFDFLFLIFLKLYKILNIHKILKIIYR